MPSSSLRPPLAALLIAGAGAVLLLVGLLGADERPAAAASALSAAAAVAGAWLLGARPPAGDPTDAPGRARRRAGRRTTAAFTAAFLVSLGAGTLLTAALPASREAGTPAFPPSLSALILGVFAAPLLLTSLGFALTFRPPSANDLDRLRRAAGATPAEDDDAR